ncbi:hypothetical protein CUJ89_06925 [Burkholderia pyrrocinia]|uniref:Uncharacterized protein n=1 Tax=Burkholderia pyrrocinia TaxID=60550 RepID=A0A2Z5MUE7_BURPY|nr:hypothetical protein CUJ89_06925 [Burkholderia pyrrocinia]
MWTPDVLDVARRMRDMREFDAVVCCAYVWCVSLEQAREQIAARVAFACLSGRQIDFHDAALCLADRETRHV